MRNRIATGLFLAAVYATQAGHDSCSGDLLHDSGFDLWCGEELCSWQVEKGEVRQAATWHQEDHGVELIGDEVAISQVTTTRDVSCVRFDLVADIELDAAVVLEMDLYDDGEVDHSERLPTAAWQDLSYLVRMPAHFQGIRFRLRKSGGGRAVLAQIRARDDGPCEGAPLAQPIAPLGATCWSLDEEAVVLDHELCASGTCAPANPGDPASATCAGCDASGDCGADQACGVESPGVRFLDPYRSCVPAASRGLGEMCAGDDECITSVCCGGFCGDCCSDGRDCADGAGCEGIRAPEGWLASPQQCDPRGGTRTSGAACLDDADCASGSCRGGEPLSVCLADRRLCDEDADCPADFTQEGADFGSCVAIGVTRGTCD